jgi:hypothetical protein
VTLLGGLIVFWALALGDPSDADTSSPPTGSSAESSAEATETTGEESSPATDESTSASETESAAGPAQAVTDFFALIPDDLPAAHQLTSPAFQAEFPLERFSGFWDDFESVQVSNVEAQDDTTALVDITYVRPGGSSETERHRITFVPGENGQLLLDQDEIA